MKKVVVVSEHEQIFFEGKNLEVINRAVESIAGMNVPNLLVIMDGKETIGVVNVWLYWKKLE